MSNQAHSSPLLQTCSFCIPRDSTWSPLPPSQKLDVILDSSLSQIYHIKLVGKSCTSYICNFSHLCGSNLRSPYCFQYTALQGLLTSVLAFSLADPFLLPEKAELCVASQPKLFEASVGHKMKFSLHSRDCKASHDLLLPFLFP